MHYVYLVLELIAINVVCDFIRDRYFSKMSQKTYRWVQRTFYKQRSFIRREDEEKTTFVLVDNTANNDFISEITGKGYIEEWPNSPWRYR